MERFLKYLKITYRWITGVTIELIYPLVTFTAAAIVCSIIYMLFIIKK